MQLPRYTPRHAAQVWRLPPEIVHRAVKRGLPGVTTGEDGLPRIHGRVVEDYRLTGAGQLRAPDGRFIDHDELDHEIAQDEHDLHVFELEQERWNS